MQRRQQGTGEQSLRERWSLREAERQGVTNRSGTEFLSRPRWLHRLRASCIRLRAQALAGLVQRASRTAIFSTLTPAPYLRDIPGSNGLRSACLQPGDRYARHFFTQIFRVRPYFDMAIYFARRPD